MKSRITIPVLTVCCALAIGACTGLKQFPEASEDYSGDLGKQDKDYETALNDIESAKDDPAEMKRIRNEEIDRRLRVIDLNFSEFRKGLATEGVTADFGIAVAQLGLGGAGALVSQTASQILSAVSGGLAGTQQAYSKAALYEKTVSALFAQMKAGRKVVLVRIVTGRVKSIDDYPLSIAVLDLEAYAYAGSLPGAVIGTAADAQVKNDEAKNQIRDIQRKSEDAAKAARDLLENLLNRIEALSDTDAIALATTPPVQDDQVDTLLAARDPGGTQPWLRVASVAKQALKMRVSFASVNDLAKWDAALQ